MKKYKDIYEAMDPFYVANNMDIETTTVQHIAEDIEWFFTWEEKDTEFDKVVEEAKSYGIKYEHIEKWDTEEETTESYQQRSYITEMLAYEIAKLAVEEAKEQIRWGRELEEMRYLPM
jgi:hypothetical protein